MGRRFKGKKILDVKHQTFVKLTILFNGKRYVFFVSQCFYFLQI